MNDQVPGVNRQDSGRSLDLLAIAVGSAVAALASLALVAIARRAWGTPADTGPTAAALADATHDWYAAGAGVCIGCAVATALSRRAPIWNGLISGGLACVLVLTPAFILTLPDDVTSDEKPGFVPFVLIALVPFALIGTLLGAIVRAVLPNRRGGAPVAS